MVNKKMVAGEDGLKNIAVAVGSALGKLAQKIGLGGATAAPAPRPAKTTVARGSAKSKKKVAIKNAVTKRAIVKRAKVRSPKV